MLKNSRCCAYAKYEFQHELVLESHQIKLGIAWNRVQRALFKQLPLEKSFTVCQDFPTKIRSSKIFDVIARNGISVVYKSLNYEWQAHRIVG